MLRAVKEKCHLSFQYIERFVPGAMKVKRRPRRIRWHGELVYGHAIAAVNTLYFEGHLPSDAELYGSPVTGLMHDVRKCWVGLVSGALHHAPPPINHCAQLSSHTTHAFLASSVF